MSVMFYLFIFIFSADASGATPTTLVNQHSGHPLLLIKAH